MSDLFNFKNELKESQEQLKFCYSKINQVNRIREQESDELQRLRAEIIEIAKSAGISLEEILEPQTNTVKISHHLEWDDDFFLNHDPLLIESKVKREVFKNPALLPPLTKLDYAMVCLAGVIATILDIFIVKIPKDINYLGKYQQDGSKFTGWLRSLGVDERGQLNPFLEWCEKTCKVPYDQSINSGIKGFNPKSHRLMNLGHDPLFGLIFGIFDIFNGSMTAFDTNGKLQIVKTLALPIENQVFAPLIWLGHIISDMCTKMGVPIPGWGFLQLMQFGAFGNKKSIANISRWMYLNGYDIRHFITMSISPAAIEIIIRSYYYLSYLENREKLPNSLASREITHIKSNLKLHKMLFLAHAMGASGNGIKIFLNSGNPLAINISQWLFLLKESIEIVKFKTRDITTEKIIRNRQEIDKQWQEIKNIDDNIELTSTIYYDYFKLAE